MPPAAIPPVVVKWGYLSLCLVGLGGVVTWFLCFGDNFPQPYRMLDEFTALCFNNVLFIIGSVMGRRGWRSVMGRAGAVAGVVLLLFNLCFTLVVFRAYQAQWSQLQSAQ